MEDKTEQDINIEELNALVEADKQKRAHAFKTYMDKGAIDYRCTLVAVPFIDGEGRIRARIQIFPGE